MAAGQTGIPFQKARFPIEDPESVLPEKGIKVHQLQPPTPTGHKIDEDLQDVEIHVTESKADSGLDWVDVENMAKTDNGNGYQFIRHIAGGAYGQVYEVKLTHTIWMNIQEGTRLALKLMKIPTELQDDEDKIANQVNEVCILLDIGRTRPVHPNLLNAYEIVTTESMQRAYFIMRLSEHGSLHKVAEERWNIDQDIFYQEEIKHIVRGIADGVRFLKEHLGISHCDLKPDNVLLFDNPDSTSSHDMYLPKLGDFGNGVKRKPNNNPDLCQAIGMRCTIGFHAPETYENDDIEYNAFVADVYSVGCVIYWMWQMETLTTSLPQYRFADPYNEINIQHVLQQQSFGAVWTRINERINAAMEEDPTENLTPLRSLLISMLNREPSGRLTIEQVLLHDYFQQ